MSSPLTTPQFGGLDVAGNSTATTIAGATTPAKFALWSGSAAAEGVSPDAGNDWLYLREGGKYRLAVSATIDSVAGSAAAIFRVLIRKASGPTTLGYRDANFAGGGGERQVIAFHVDAALVATDKGEVWLENRSGSDNILLETGDFTALRLGD